MPESGSLSVKPFSRQLMHQLGRSYQQTHVLLLIGRCAVLRALGRASDDPFKGVEKFDGLNRRPLRAHAHVDQCRPCLFAVDRKPPKPPGKLKLQFLWPFSLWPKACHEFQSTRRVSVCHGVTPSAAAFFMASRSKPPGGAGRSLSRSLSCSLTGLGVPVTPVGVVPDALSAHV